MPIAAECSLLRAVHAGERHCFSSHIHLDAVAAVNGNESGAACTNLHIVGVDVVVENVVHARDAEQVALFQFEHALIVVAVELFELHAVYLNVGGGKFLSAKILHMEHTAVHSARSIDDKLIYASHFELFAFHNAKVSVVATVAAVAHKYDVARGGKLGTCQLIAPALGLTEELEVD